jgi:carbon-monoxide dehydrogenase large subunit
MTMIHQDQSSRRVGSDLVAATADAGALIGQPVQRVEDARLVRGQSRYVSDIAAGTDTLHMVVVRSPEAHARIRSIDKTAAQAVHGVVQVLTGDDLTAVRPLPCDWVPPGMEVVPQHPILAEGTVRYAGEPVAAVIAETKAAAGAGARAMALDLEPLVPLVHQEAAIADGASALHATLPDNRGFSSRRIAGSVDRAFAQADNIVKRRLTNNRVTAAPLEGRAVFSRFDPVTGQLIHHTSTQLPHVHARSLATCLGFPQQKLQLISPDVGGGFGAKLSFYAEDVMAAFAAIRTGRPVLWVEDRTEHFLATTHGRDHVQYVELAARADGKILGMKATVLADLGAYAVGMGPGVPAINAGVSLTGPYRIENVDLEVVGIYTNRTPTGPYRGAGHPEASYMLERMIDELAVELDLDPVAVRKTNFVPPSAMPYKIPIGFVLDSGNYAANLDQALSHVDRTTFRAEQAAARREGRHLGMGIAIYSEMSGAAPSIGMAAVGFRRSGHESARVVVHADGRATIFSGAHSHGQGHATSLAQIAGEVLQLPVADIEVIQGDTRVVPFGTGTFNSRSMPVGGTAVFKAAEKIVAKAKKIAANKLQVRASDLDFEDGAFRFRPGVGVGRAFGRMVKKVGAAATGAVFNHLTRLTLPKPDRSVHRGRISFAEVAQEAHLGHDVPFGMVAGLDETVFFDPKVMPVSYATHIAIVEVDTGTGEIHLNRHIVVDDCGRIINPLLARGQVHGGIAQGAGQALMEHIVHDDEGRLLSDAFSSYAMPRASDLPDFETDHTVVPTKANPLGAKGIGEGGAIGAPPAIVNAALDALRPLGVRDLEMPLTPMRVWRAIDAAAKGTSQ